MIKRSLKNPETVFLINDNSEMRCYGCEQEWYNSDWQRRSGCGPTTACNLLLYLEFTRLSNKQDRIPISKEQGMARMQESWTYVTPTDEGIPTTKVFCEKFFNYAKANHLNVACHSININKENQRCSEFEDVVKFIEAAMLNDSPVAFLNLCNGKVNNLEGWHWVTIISLEYDMNETKAYISILDEGLIKKVDLKLWCDTTILGGGFVYFEAVNLQQ